jgi:hypothetical protein
MVLSPASGALANIQPWWPARFGLIAFIMCILTTLLVLPETLVKPALPSSTQGQRTQLQEEELDEDDDPVLYADVQKNTRWRYVRKAVSSLRTLRFLIASRQVLLLVPLLSVGQLYDQSAEFFINYVSRRYGWRISQVRSLMSLCLCKKISAELIRHRPLGKLLVDISQRRQSRPPKYDTTRRKHRTSSSRLQCGPKRHLDISREYPMPGRGSLRYWIGPYFVHHGYR